MSMNDEHFRYLGVLSLLGEFAVYLDDEDRERVEIALDDAFDAGAISYKRVGDRFLVDIPKDPA